MSTPLLQHLLGRLNVLRHAPPDQRRRAMLRAAAMLAAGSIAAPLSVARAQARVRFPGYPFALGVASGYPQPDGFTLWTRLAAAPLEAGGGTGEEPYDVGFEVAEDERFGKVVAKGARRAMPETAHCVHADVHGLQPDRWYFYRFLCGDEVSAIGRTRTAPAHDASPQRLRFAIGSCQHYEQAYFAAHRHLAAEDLDLMVFLGDYIYEGTWGDDLVRRHVRGECLTLDDYRVRHAQYKSDPDLQRLHGLVPWLVTWDDHEVDNDYGGAQGEFLDPRFLERRAAAYQAYWEHLPLPERMRPAPDGLRLYDRVGFGRLANFHLVDDRQYRTPQACPDPRKGGGGNDVVDCAAIDDPTRTLLGAEQMRWLEQGLTQSRTQWNVLAQQTLMARWDSDPGPGKKLWTDAWDGYPRDRQRVLDAFAQRNVRNPLVVGGDLHASIVADLRHRIDDTRSPIVATEFCGTSVASQGWPKDAFAVKREANPDIHLAESHRRGYTRFDLDANGCRVAIRLLDDEKKRDSGVTTAYEFAVENDKPGVQKV